MSYIQELFTSRNNGANGDDFVGKQGRIWWDPTTNCFYYSDGQTPGGIPIGAGALPAYGEFATETSIATEDQTSFDLINTPSGKISGSINGATMAAESLTNIGIEVTYKPEFNDDYILRDGDEITFSYLYGTANSSTLGGLGDVSLGNTQGGQVLMYDGSKNLWVAGSPNGTLQNGIQNGTTVVRILEENGPISYKISGIADKMIFDVGGINIVNAGYKVNGNLAVNGPTIKIENKNSSAGFDACDRPIVLPYKQDIPVNVSTRVEYSRLCWDTVSRFNPTANNITIGGVTIQPWSWRPLVPGYYQVSANAVLEATTTPTTPNSMSVKQFIATAGQDEFIIDGTPQGKVIFVINGAVIDNGAITFTGMTATYDPAGNEGYIINTGDEIAIYYIVGTSTGSSGSARLSIQVQGNAVVTGSRQAMISAEYTIDANGILLLTPADNVSVSVLVSGGSAVKVAYSALSLSMVRGIE
jgi:hypothetical protein